MRNWAGLPRTGNWGLPLWWLPFEVPSSLPDHRAHREEENKQQSGKTWSSPWRGCYPGLWSWTMQSSLESLSWFTMPDCWNARLLKECMGQRVHVSESCSFCIWRKKKNPSLSINRENNWLFHLWLFLPKIQLCGNIIFLIIVRLGEFKCSITNKSTGLVNRRLGSQCCLSSLWSGELWNCDLNILWFNVFVFQMGTVIPILLGLFMD